MIQNCYLNVNFKPSPKDLYLSKTLILLNWWQFGNFDISKTQFYLG